MITLFEDFKEPDLRRIGKYVLCIKELSFHFTKGKYYKVLNFDGDPQGAVEKYGINDYLPVECISRVAIYDDYNKLKEFRINIIRYADLLKFFDFFEIPEFSEQMDKYNL